MHASYKSLHIVYAVTRTITYASNKIKNKVKKNVHPVCIKHTLKIPLNNTSVRIRDLSVCGLRHVTQFLPHVDLCLKALVISVSVVSSWISSLCSMLPRWIIKDSFCEFLVSLSPCFLVCLLPDSAKKYTNKHFLTDHFRRLKIKTYSKNYTKI